MLLKLVKKAQKPNRLLEAENKQKPKKKKEIECFDETKYKLIELKRSKCFLISWIFWIRKNRRQGDF